MTNTTKDAVGLDHPPAGPVCPRCGNTDRKLMEIRNGVAEYCVACHSCMRPCCNRSLRATPQAAAPAEPPCPVRDHKGYCIDCDGAHQAGSAAVQEALAMTVGKEAANATEAALLTLAAEVRRQEALLQEALNGLRQIYAGERSIAGEFIRDLIAKLAAVVGVQQPAGSGGREAA